MEGTHTSGTASNRRLNLWLLGTLLLCFLYFLPRPGNWNEDSRLDAALAVVNHGTLAVDQYRWNAGVDTTYVNGHYYANKAPGQILTLVPVIAAYRGVLTLVGEGKQSGEIGYKRTWHKLFFLYYIAQCLAALYTVGVPAAFFFLLFFWFLGFFSGSTGVRLALTLGTALGTAMLPYSQVIYPHVPTAAMLFAAFALIFALGLARSGGDPRSRLVASHPDWAAALAGVSLGGAFLFDHTAALPGVTIGLYALLRLTPRQVALMAAGGLPFLALTLAFNHFVFGSSTTTGYNPAGSSGGGVGGSEATGVPSWAGVCGLTFSPYRGLFFMSPFLLLVAPGAVFLARRWRYEAILCVGMPLAYLLFVSSISFWHGGSAVGPRYLVPVIPFVALPIVEVLNRATRSRRWLALVVVLLALSVANVWLQTVASGFPPVKDYNPLFHFALPHVARGALALSWGSIILAPFTGIHSKWTFVPLPVVIFLWTWYRLGWDAIAGTVRAVVPARSRPRGAEPSLGVPRAG